MSEPLGGGGALKAVGSINNSWDGAGGAPSDGRVGDAPTSIRSRPATAFDRRFASTVGVAPERPVCRDDGVGSRSRKTSPPFFDDAPVSSALGSTVGSIAFIRSATDSASASRPSFTHCVYAIWSWSIASFLRSAFTS